MYFKRIMEKKDNKREKGRNKQKKKVKVDSCQSPGKGRKNQIIQGVTLTV